MNKQQQKELMLVIMVEAMEKGIYTLEEMQKQMEQFCKENGVA